MSETELDLDAIQAKATAAVHRHAGQAKCTCGWDAYKIRGIMVDYAQAIDDHVYDRRQSVPTGANAQTTVALVAEIRRLQAGAQIGDAFRTLIVEGAKALAAEADR